MEANRAIKPTKGRGEPLEIYELVNILFPKASPGNVVVRIVLRPVNPTDLFVVRWGAWANLDLSNAVVGSEGVGLIHEVGEGVTKLKAGQRVIPLIWSRYYSTGYGLWRDYVEVPEIDIVPVPEDISDEVAAQFFINPWTAYGFLKTLDIPKGGYLLQAAAASVLGRQIIQLAKYYGIKTINVVRRDAWIQPLKDLGADYVMNSSTEDVKARVKEITGGDGAYGALDPVGGESTRVEPSCLAKCLISMSALASSVRNGGKVLVYGGLSASHIIVDLRDLIRQVSVSFWRVSDYSHDLPKRWETVTAILDLLSNNVIHPLRGKTFPLEQFKNAIKESEAEARGGKLFLSS